MEFQVFILNLRFLLIGTVLQRIPSLVRLEQQEQLQVLGLKYLTSRVLRISGK